MSNIYLTEPPTSGKVLLHTTCGDIDIELWAKECPLACRNFVQHCMDGYYNNNVFHRVIKDFMAQTGDPSGTGKGGTSIWGRPFKDEIHGRIKFNHRGQVACANEQASNSNHSQFFMTFGPCEWLDKKHTIFGKVTGNTIFNLLRIGDMDVDKEDRPLEDIILLSTEVLWNPFDDIIPKQLSATANSTSMGSKNGTTSSVLKADRKGTKDSKLLSFLDEENDNSFVPSVPSQSTLKGLPSKSDGVKASPIPSECAAIPVSIHSSSSAVNISSAATAESVKDKLQRLKQELVASRKEAVNVTTARGPELDGKSEGILSESSHLSVDNRKRSFLEDQKAKYIQHKTAKLKRGDEAREEDTLARLTAFTNNMQKTQNWAFKLTD